ncbi:ribonuclease P protein component [Mycoplasma sp. E35C]|uniref:ribonuclease P protein component n=1 Tax=Mycoplasma sp. E35C TaxID=2801918 RepID=UPI001CA4359D|nr:ribonuclease P protein component [Mycoplasma sp. E35C]QZX49154.1 ribonuclease P protein component [Mycoplasma sp. E35C]
MKRKHSLKKVTSFLEIVKTKSKYYSKNYIIYANKNNESLMKVGIVVPKKLFAKAVVRNKIKRQVRTFFDDFKDFNKGLNLLVKINNTNFLTNNYQTNKQEFFDSYKRLTHKFKTNLM